MVLGDGQTDHQSINDDSKNKMNIVQSSEGSYNKWKKVDDGWKKINNKGNFNYFFFFL